MNNELGILFLHHKINNVTLNNLSSIKKYNPLATIVTMSAKDPLPDGYTLNATPKIRSLHSVNPHCGADWLVCSWFVQRKEQCQRWCIVEWDTFCRISVNDYYQPVWNFPYVASSLRLTYREPEWTWFRSIKEMPKEFRPYAMGTVPFLYLISDHALNLICSTLLKKPFSGGNSQLRFSTVANKCGVAPCGYSPPNDQITWMKLTRATDQKKIFHPIKHIVDI